MPSDVPSDEDQTDGSDEDETDEDKPGAKDAPDEEELALEEEWIRDSDYDGYESDVNDDVAGDSPSAPVVVPDPASAAATSPGTSGRFAQVLRHTFDLLKHYTQGYNPFTERTEVLELLRPFTNGF